MIDSDELRVALGEWRLLSLAPDAHTPAAALASVLAVCGDTDEAVGLLARAAYEALWETVDVARRYPLSAPVWEHADQLLLWVRVGLPLIAARELRTLRSDVERGTDGTGSRSERGALLRWCDRVERGLAILRAIETEAAKQNQPQKEARRGAGQVHERR